jgi:hypothetical protein
MINIWPVYRPCHGVFMPCLHDVSVDTHFILGCDVFVGHVTIGMQDSMVGVPNIFCPFRCLGCATSAVVPLVACRVRLP